MPETGDAAFVRALDLVVMKRRYSAFHGTDLGDRRGAWGRDQVVVTGVYAAYGA